MRVYIMSMFQTKKNKQTFLAMGKKINNVIVETNTASFEPFKSQYCRLTVSHLRDQLYS